MLAFFAGNVIYLYQSAVGEAAFPSWADVGYLGIYPCLLAGLLLALRQHLRGSGLVVLLDGIIGMAAAAAVVAVAINPLVVRLWDGSAAAVVSVAYPVCDGILVVASLSALGLVGHGRGRVFGLWAMGLLVFAVADVFYAYRVAFDTYQVGTWLDAMWAAGFALVALGGSSRRVPVIQQRSRASHRWSYSARVAWRPQWSSPWRRSGTPLSSPSSWRWGPCSVVASARCCRS